MDQTDIILYILNILANRKEAGTIKNCLSINKLWYSLIKTNPKKYLKTPEMMIYLIEKDKEFRGKMDRRILEIILGLQIHTNLNKHLPIYSETLHKNLLKYFPNSETNGLLIAKKIENDCYQKLLLFLRKYLELPTSFDEINIENAKSIFEIILRITYDLRVAKLFKGQYNQSDFDLNNTQEIITHILNKLIDLLILNNRISK